MKRDRHTIPIRETPPDWAHAIPGAVAFAETPDEDEDALEQGDILSFAALREAFAVINKTEAELNATVAESAAGSFAASDSESEPASETAVLEVEQPEAEQPEYDWDETATDEITFPAAETKTEPMPEIDLRGIIEAVFFVGNKENKPVMLDRIAEKLRNVSAEDIIQEILLLNEHYRQQNRPLTIIPDRGGYRMTLRPEYAAVQANFHGKVREVRLSQSAIDTLAAVAYRQPLTTEEVQKLRQQPSAAVLTQLVRRGLIQAQPQSEGKKKTAVYRTTSRFLQLLHLSSLDDLPKADEIGYR